MKKFMCTALLIAVLLFALSCAGGPATTPEEKAPETKTTETTKEITDTKVPAPEGELAEAKELRDRIVRFGLDKTSPEEFAKAEGLYKTGEAAYGKDNTAAKAALDESIASYKEVIRSGFSEVIGKWKADIEAAKREAEEVKAPVAVPEDYGAAESAYQAALQAEKDGEYEKALEEFDRAKSLFVTARNRAIEKRQMAEKALAEAKAGLSRTEEKAKEYEEARKKGGTQ
jgi:hypothetical protein